MAQPSPTANNSRLGIRLFLIYAAFYLGFVLVNAFAAEWVDRTPVAGLNIAVLWGFALIGLAFVLAVFYGLACQSDAAESNATESPTAEESNR